MSNRDIKETKNLFDDPKFARKAWKSVGAAILQNPAKVVLGGMLDKDGNPTVASEIERYSYDALARDLKNIRDVNDTSREPTNLEMILMCQIVRARYDTNAAVFVRDTVGAKPVDESKLDAVVSNPYESLTDEELEMIAKARERNGSAPEPTDAPTDTL